MKSILFVCVENSCRSQMAEGFARYYGKGKFKIFSAGSRPSGKINPEAIAVMGESGIDISRQSSKGFDDLPVKEFDYIVTLGCKDVCPMVPARDHREWNIPDPQGGGIEFFRSVRDEIRMNVRRLLEDILEA